MENRFGKFSIGARNVRKKPRQVAQMLGILQFVPMRVESFDYEAYFEYRGLSPKFRRLEKGELIPEYRIVLSSDQTGNVTNCVAEEQTASKEVHHGPGS